MITPYPHQIKMIDDASSAYRLFQSVLMYGPTGIGKTNMAALILLRLLQRQKRAIMAVHRDNLLHQTARTFDEFGIPFGYIAAGMSFEKWKPVHIASIQTLARRLEKVPVPHLLIVDEAHLAAAKTWSAVVDFYRSHGTRILGLSGSPTRLDGKPLSNLFETMVMGPSVRWLIDNGFLSEYVAYCPSHIDLSGVRTQMGDFNQAQLAEAVDKPAITGDAVEHYRKLALGTRAVCYCVSIAHSKHVAESFNAAGIPAGHIDGTTPKGEQQQIIRDFADGKILVLCNVELITTGFDLSAQVGRDVPIETMIGLRPTQSLALHLQCIGRALRRKPKPAILLDHAGNILRHGLPDDEREWDLSGQQVKRGKKRAEDDTLPIRQCDQCYTVHRPAPICPTCGYVYPNKARQIETVAGELRAVSRDNPPPKPAPSDKKREQSTARSFEQLVELGRARGYKNPSAWASHIWQARAQRGMTA